MSGRPSISFSSGRLISIHPSSHPIIHPSSLHIDRLLVLQAKVDEHSQAITRLKTIWPLVAAGIALIVAALRDWLFGQK